MIEDKIEAFLADKEYNVNAIRGEIAEADIVAIAAVKLWIPFVREH